MNSHLIPVAVFRTRLEADLAKLRLDSVGLRSFISADDAGGMRPGVFSYSPGVELIVREQDLEKAKEALNTDKTQET